MATPFHSTERCFRRYEQVIADATASYPKDTKFYCTKRSSTTDAARLSDACNSYAKQNWYSLLIDREKFLTQVYRRVSILPRDGHVLITPKKPPQVEVISTTTAETFAGEIDQPTTEQLDLAINAINYNVVSLPIQLTNLTPGQIVYIAKAVSECFNVAINQINDTTIILI